MHEQFRFPPIRDTSAALKIQASYFDKPFVITRPTQDEYVKDGPQRTYALRVRARQTTQAAACSLRAGERQGPRQGLQNKKHGDQDAH
jgi:hypothetical protein